MTDTPATPEPPAVPTPPPAPKIPDPPAIPKIPDPPPIPKIPEPPPIPKIPAPPPIPKIPAPPPIPKVPAPPATPKVPAMAAPPAAPAAPSVPGAAARPAASPAAGPAAAAAAAPKAAAAAAAPKRGGAGANGQAAANTKPEKAKLILKSADPGNPTIAEVKFQFNPKELSISKKATWKREGAAGAKETPMPQFDTSAPRTMSLDIFMDAVEDKQRDLVKDIDNLFQCCKPVTESVSKGQPSPPFVLFAWGKTVHFSAFVSSVTVKITIFSPEGKPMRATAKVDLEEIPTDLAKQNPTSGALASQRTHRVIEGDNLQSIAYREYGNPAFWRAVAEANKIDDPLRLRSGTTLLLPSPDETSGVV